MHHRYDLMPASARQPPFIEPDIFIIALMSPESLRISPFFIQMVHFQHTIFCNVSLIIDSDDRGIDKIIIRVTVIGNRKMQPAAVLGAGNLPSERGVLTLSSSYAFDSPVII